MRCVSSRFLTALPRLFDASSSSPDRRADIVFSLRARAGAPVSMPLRWEDLGKLKSGDAWTLRNAPARLKRLKAHPWGDFMALRQSLDGIVD